MNAERNINAQPDECDAEIELPLVKLTKTDVLGALFVHIENEGESYKDALLKLQTWIINFAEEQVRPLRESGYFTDDEIEKIKKKSCVISPITLTLYIHYLQMESFVRMTDSEKEKYLLERIPDRFKARFKGNAACRNAREVMPEEEAEKAEDTNAENDSEAIQRKSFAEFLQEFGEEVKRELKSLETKD